MALKRKRSIPAFPASNSSCFEHTLFESPTIPNIPWAITSGHHSGMDKSSDNLIEDAELSSRGAIEALPQHLDSRTRKRFRNDRPVDEVVHGQWLLWIEIYVI